MRNIEAKQFFGPPDAHQNGVFSEPQKVPEGDLAELHEITADSLWQDNHSPLAEARRNEFNEAGERGEIATINRCSDSRYILYPIYNAIPTISVGGKKEPYKGIYNHPGTQYIVVLTHDPCGGLGVKEELSKKGTLDDIGDSGTYVQEDIQHHDPIVQGIRVARDVSRLTDKEVFVAVHTQANGINHPVGATYRDGKPIFNGRRNPKNLEVFLQRNEAYVAEIVKEFPNLKKMQQVQNPDLLVVSRNRRPAECEYPQTTRRPGSTFRIFIPEEEEQYIDPTAARKVIDQAHYPISHFSNLSRILIETDSMDTSAWMLRKIMQRPWMREWAQNPEHEIYFAKSSSGELYDIFQWEGKYAF